MIHLRIYYFNFFKFFLMSRSVSTIVCVDKFLGRNGSTICISCDKELYSMGVNKKGGNGQKDNTIFLYPQKVISLTNIQAVDCGFEHTICLDTMGNVYTFGSNEYGVLGIGLKEDELAYTHLPQKVNLPPVKQISCGDIFNICVTEEHTLFSFGLSNFGQLGHGNTHNFNMPKLIENLENVNFVTCAKESVICKTFDDSIYAWGSNMSLQLGFRDKSTIYSTPSKCINWPNNIIDIKCGSIHVIMLSSEGDVYSCGSNYFGQLGRDTNKDDALVDKIESLSDIMRIECGYLSSICIDTKGDVYIFGNNLQGQLGCGHFKNIIEPLKHPSLSNIIDVSSKGSHIFVKTSSNKILGFGDNSTFQLGIHTKEQFQLFPIRLLEDKEDIWVSNINKSNAKSARF